MKFPTRYRIQIKYISIFVTKIWKKKCCVDWTCLSYFNFISESAEVVSYNKGTGKGRHEQIIGFASRIHYPSAALVCKFSVIPFWVVFITVFSTLLSFQRFQCWVSSLGHQPVPNIMWLVTPAPDRIRTGSTYCIGGKRSIHWSISAVKKKKT